MELLRPEGLKEGDAVAIISPSWGGPSLFPRVYENGLRSLESLGLRVKEFPTARAANEILSNNPELRAKDVCDAFSDTEIRAIIPSIGGNDSVRILPFLDPDAIRKNPKILMGFSDTSTLLTYCNQLGLVTFNGPSVMSGFSQMESLGEQFRQHVVDILFGGGGNYEYASYPEYSEGYPNWGDESNV